MRVLAICLDIQEAIGNFQHPDYEETSHYLPSDVFEHHGFGSSLKEENAGQSKMGSEELLLRFFTQSSFEGRLKYEGR